MRAAARDIRAKGIQSVGVASIFSPLDPAHEELAGDILAEECPGAAVTLSHRLGRIGLLERENAALLNAALAGMARDTIAGFRAAIAISGIDAPLYLTQNDGTVMSADMAMALPVMSFASGATNSMSTALRPISASFGTAFRGKPIRSSRSARCARCSACPICFPSLSAAAVSFRPTRWR